MKYDLHIYTEPHDSVRVEPGVADNTVCISVDDDMFLTITAEQALKLENSLGQARIYLAGERKLRSAGGTEDKPGNPGPVPPVSLAPM